MAKHTMDANDATMTHGLDGTLVEPDWPPLTLAEVREVLSRYPAAGRPAKLLTVSPRPLSAASVVATSGAPVFVKRHHAVVRDMEGLREEHRFMAHLRARGVTAPEVFATEAGETAIQIGEWTYEVHAIPPGIDLYADAISWTPFRSEDHAYSAGAALARCHVAAKGYEAPARRNRPLVAGFTIFASAQPEEEFDRYVGERPALYAYLRARSCREETMALLKPLHAELAPMLPQLAPLWTHNDWHSSNLMWSDRSANARPTAVIDFGLADRTNAVHDLAHAIERSMIDWLALINQPKRPENVTVHYDALFALLDGYESVRPLGRDESCALAPMLALCHAEFALSETDYFLNVLHSEAKAWYACEGYLVLHARWFRGAGAKLLDALRTWSATRHTTMQRREAQ
jgi:Ser/Thr protein kinase RdoA (MazF antagonist)